MIERVKNYLRRSALLAFSRMFYVIIVLFIQFYFSRHLPKGIFGSYQQYFIQVGFCGAILTAALPYSIGLMKPEDVWVNFKALLHKARWIILAVFTGVIVTLCFTSASSIWVLILLILATVCCTLQDAILINWGKDYYVLVVNLVYTVLFLLLHLVLMPVTGNVSLLLQGWLLLLLLRFGTGSYLVFTNENVRAAGEKKITQILYKQWLWLWANDVLENIFTYLDKLFLIFLISQELYAVYIMGASEVPFFTIIVSVIGFQFNVHYSEESSKAETLTLFKTSTLFIACFIFPVFCFLYVEAGNIFHTFLGTRYDQSIPLFRLTVLTVPVRITYYGAIIQVMKKNKFILFGSILSFVVYVVLIPILYHYFHLQGLIVATIIATYLQAIYYLWISSRLLGISIRTIFPFLHLLLMLGANIICFGIVAKMQVVNSSILAILVGLLPLLLMFGLNYFGIYKPYVKKKLTP